ncbi:MAG TPA: 30S ribosomal protein S7 [Caldisericia bacterium]|jgi:small subunit ribosomal protein S7|nr:30S ribosomal protein S7 [Caldisericia bacterium]
MPRRKLINKKELQPDPLYGNILITQFVGKLLQEGKKQRAMKIMYGALNIASEKTKNKPVEVLEAAIDRVRPVVEVRPRRIGGATYQIPTEVPYEKGVSLAIKWIITSSRKKKGKPMMIKLANEFIDAFNKTGDAYKKREDTHRMAEANKAFAHFKW